MKHILMPRGLYHKTYYGRNLRISVISQSVCPSLSSLVQCLCVRPGAYPSEAPFRYSTLGQASGLAHKHQTRLERLARDKHSSLLRKSVNYDCNKFYDTCRWCMVGLPISIYKHQTWMEMSRRQAPLKIIQAMEQYFQKCKQQFEYQHLLILRDI